MAEREGLEPPTWGFRVPRNCQLCYLSMVTMLAIRSKIKPNSHYNGYYAEDGLLENHPLRDPSLSKRVRNLCDSPSMKNLSQPVSGVLFALRRGNHPS